MINFTKIFNIFTVLFIFYVFRQEVVSGINVAGLNHFGSSSSRAWEFSLNYDQCTVCQASLLNKRWAITAAQCVSGRTDPSKFFIVSVSNHSTGIHKGQKTKIGVKKIVVRSAKLPRNIALLELNTRVPKMSRDSFINLPNYGSRVQLDTRCYISEFLPHLAIARRKFENLAYGLHFHSLANYISANYYEELDQSLMYLSTLSTALVTAFGGTLVASLYENAGNSRVKSFATLVTMTSTVATEAISKINSSDHSPGKKRALHHQAAYRMNELCDQVQYFVDTLDDEGDLEAVNSKFEEFLRERKKIEQECSKSEAWTFPQVHNELSPRWKALAIKLGKYVPDEKDRAKRSVNFKIVFLCGSAVALYGLWRATYYIA